MASIWDVARIEVSGMPELGDTPGDAWQTWLRARNSIIDGNRAAPGKHQALAVLGVPGHLRAGHLADIRLLIWPAGQPRDAPYSASAAADPEEKEAAARRWKPVQQYLTRQTANMVCAETHAPPTPSVWWVRDVWNGTELTDDEYAEFRRVLAELARPAPAGVPMPRFTPEPAVVTVPAPSVVTVPAPAAASAVAASPAPPSGERYACRYRLVNSCTAVYDSRQGLYAHEELAVAHSDHRLPLKRCPLCGKESTISGRAMHLSRFHGIEAGTQERQNLDAEQTRQLWDARASRQATITPPPDEPADTTEEDPDVLAVIGALGKTRAAAAAAPAGEPEPEPEMPRWEKDIMALQDAMPEQDVAEAMSRRVLAEAGQQPAAMDPVAAIIAIVTENTTLKAENALLRAQAGPLQDDAAQYRRIKDLMQDH